MRSTSQVETSTEGEYADNPQLFGILYSYMTRLKKATSTGAVLSQHRLTHQNVGMVEWNELFCILHQLELRARLDIQYGIENSYVAYSTHTLSQNQKGNSSTKLRSRPLVAQTTVDVCTVHSYSTTVARRLPCDGV